MAVAGPGRNDNGDPNRVTSVLAQPFSLVETPRTAERGVTEDAALVRRARAGDEGAFGQLVRRYENRVLALSRRATRTRQDAEDVAQETFLRVWRALERFDTARPFAPWLLTIAVRTARSHAAREHRKRMIGLKLAEPAPPPIEPATADGTIWEEVDRLLPLTTRLALWLKHGEKLASPAIAAAIGKSETATRAIISRAHRTLRESLDKEALDGT